MTEQTRNQYEALKARCRQQVDKQERKPWEALGELYAWFGDFHLRVGIYSQPYMRKVPTYEEMKEYNPSKTFRKVTDHTFLIRFPSCMGDDPTLEWVHQSIELYDRKGYVDGVEIRNTPAHIAEIAEIELDWIQQVVENMKKSQDEFVAMTPRQVELVYDTIFPLPHQAALIIDGQVASAGEQMVLNLRSCSQRTTIYGQDNTKGCLDYSNCRGVNLPQSGITLYIPMTRSCRLPDNGVDQTGIAPDVRIPLPLPETLTDNMDEWTQWVAKELEKKPNSF